MLPWENMFRLQNAVVRSTRTDFLSADFIFYKLIIYCKLETWVHTICKKMIFNFFLTGWNSIDLRGLADRHWITPGGTAFPFLSGIPYFTHEVKINTSLP
jgi:hypothetical protein